MKKTYTMEELQQIAAETGLLPHEYFSWKHYVKTRITARELIKALQSIPEEELDNTVLFSLPNGTSLEMTQISFFTPRPYPYPTIAVPRDRYPLLEFTINDNFLKELVQDIASQAKLIETRTDAYMAYHEAVQEAEQETSSNVVPLRPH